MPLSEEIAQLRRALAGVERDVAQLVRRLDRIEAHHEQKAKNASSESVVLRKKDDFVGMMAPTSAPPPLPPTTKAPQESVAQTPPKVTPPTATPKTPVVASLPTVPRAPKVKKPRRFGPPEDMSFEMALGSYWLPRVGMLLVAIGVVWFFTYVAQQYKESPLMPYARVGLGYMLSFGLLGVGRSLEKKYTHYARILMGGGLGLTYFVTFATWYIPGTRIAPSQEFTLALLGLLVLGWGALAQWRRSQPIAFTMTLLGHFTVALSTLSLDDPSRAAVGGLLLLGLGSAWFLIRNGWYTVAMTAMLGSYLNQYLWLSTAPPSNAFGDFVVGMSVLVAYLLTFALAELFTPPAKRTVPPRIRTIFVTLNTSGFVLLGLGLVQAFPSTQAYAHLHYFATALFALAMGVAYLYRAGNDHLSNDRVTATYLTKASVLIAIGFATWLDGNTLTLSLALESLVLLLLARYRKEHAGRLLALGSASLAFAHGIYTATWIGLPARGEAGFLGDLSIAVAVVATFFVLVELYRVTPWHRFAAPGFPTMPILNGLCHELEMMPADYTGGARPSRQFFTHSLAILGVVLLAVYSTEFLIPSSTMLSLGFALLLLVAAALYRASAPLLSGAAVLALLHGHATVDYLHGRELVSMAAFAVGSLAPLLLFAEALRLVLPSQFARYARHDDLHGAWYRNNQLIALLASGAAAVLVVVLGEAHLNVHEGMLLGGVLAVAATGYALIAGSRNLGLFGIAMVLFTGTFGVLFGGRVEEPWYAAAGLALALIAATGVETSKWGERNGLALHRLLPIPYLLYGAVALGGAGLIDASVPRPFQPLALLSLALFFGVCTTGLHRRAMSVFGTLLTIGAFSVWSTVGLGSAVGTGYHLGFVLIVATALGGDRLFAYYRSFPKPYLGRSLLVVAWLSCYRYNDFFNRSIWYYVGLAALAGAFLVYGGYFRTRTAAALSLVAACIATVPLAFLRMDDSQLVGIVAAYVSVIAYWLCAERGATLVLDRTGLKLMPGHRPLLNGVLTGIPAALGIMGLTNIDLVHDFYLTIAWTVWALVIFAWAVGTGQAWFRYVALATVGLAIGRAFLIDVWQLQGLYRVGAMIFLGLALLSVAYGYTRWRAQEEAGKAAEKAPEDSVA